MRATFAAGPLRVATRAYLAAVTREQVRAVREEVEVAMVTDVVAYVSDFPYTTWRARIAQYDFAFDLRTKSGA